MRDRPAPARQDLAFAFVHEAGLERLSIIVPDQMEHAMGDEQVQLERDRDAQARCLAPGGLGGDDHLAQQRRIERECEHVGSSVHAAKLRVEPPDLRVVDEREMQLLAGASERRERPRRRAPETTLREPDAALPVGQRNAVSGGQPAPLPVSRTRVSCAS